MGEQLVLAGDVGGTKTNLAVFGGKGGEMILLAEKSYRSQDFPSLAAMTASFLAGCSLRPEVAAIGVAGPVLQGRVLIAKLGWQVSETDLQEQLGFRVAILVNDLVATGHALPVLADHDFLTIHSGQPVPHGNRIIVAPGTGLGETMITGSGADYQVHPSEGGHCLFAPATALHLELLSFLRKQYAQVTNDLICSGRGIPLIYQFIRERSAVPEPEWLRKSLAVAVDRSAAIVEAANGAFVEDPVARATIEVFVEILASECANFALKAMAGGGVYLAGGMPPRIIDFLGTEPFMEVFASRQPLEAYLASIPVTVITNDKAALLGAARVGLRLMGQEGGYGG